MKQKKLSEARHVFSDVNSRVLSMRKALKELTHEEMMEMASFLVACDLNTRHEIADALLLFANDED